MRELEMGDKNSKSLRANVLDLEGDFILAPNSHPFEATEASEAGYGTAWFQIYQPIFTASVPKSRTFYISFNEGI